MAANPSEARNLLASWFASLNGFSRRFALAQVLGPPRARELLRPRGRPVSAPPVTSPTAAKTEAGGPG